MKILYLVYSFNLGGTEKLLVDVCNEMAKKGEETHLMVINDFYSKDLLNALDERVRVCLLKRPVGKRNLLAVSNRISKYIKNNAIDIVHCNSFNAPELLWKTKLKNKETVIMYTIHSLGGYVGLSKMRVRLRNRVCDKIICISKAIRNEIVKYGVDEKKVEVIYNGVDTNYYYDAQKKKWNRKLPVVGCLARIQPEIKGQDLLMDAVCRLVKKYPNLRCIFAGPVARGEEKAMEALKRYARDNALRNNVMFLGKVTDTRGFFEKIDILVCPSRQEGFGLSLVEGLCAGLPCVVSDVGGLLEIVRREGVGMTFAKGSSESLVEKIEYTINNYDLLSDKINKKRETIVEHYSIGLMCDKLIKEYKTAREMKKWKKNSSR